jgi:predicted dehydrogenase
MTLRVTQIGSGGWGSTWLQFIHETEGCELAALISRGGRNLQSAQDKYSIPDSACFTDIDAGLAADCDVVVVTVPHHLHVEFAKRAVEAGKNVLIEKPLSDSFEKARGLWDFVKGRDEKVWVSQNFRFREELWRLRDSLCPEQVGEFVSADILFRMEGGGKHGDITFGAKWRSDQWSMLINEITIHHFDMLRFMTGTDAVAITAQGWNPYWSVSMGPEGVVAMIEMDDGSIVSYSGQMKALGRPTGWQAQWLIQTDRGCALWDEDGLTFAPGTGETGALAAAEDFPGMDRTGVLIELMEHLEGEPCAVPTLEDNLRSFAMVCACETSVRENRPVHLTEFLD